MQKNNQNGFLKGLLLGAVVGAGVYYYLTSTKEGKKVKEKIASKTNDVLEDLSETVADFEEKAERFKSMALSAQEELAERAKVAKGEAREEIKEKMQEISELKNRGKAAAKVFFTKNGKPLSKK